MNRSALSSSTVSDARLQRIQAPTVRCTVNTTLLRDLKTSRQTAERTARTGTATVNRNRRNRVPTANCNCRRLGFGRSYPSAPYILKRLPVFGNLKAINLRWIGKTLAYATNGTRYGLKPAYPALIMSSASLNSTLLPV